MILDPRIGVTDDSGAGLELLDSFEENEKRSGSRYEVALPWKPHIDLTLSNKEIAEKRLSQLTNRLRKTPELLEAYDATNRQYWLEDVAEPVAEKNEQGKLIY